MSLDSLKKGLWRHHSACECEFTKSIHSSRSVSLEAKTSNVCLRCLQGRNTDLSRFVRGFRVNTSPQRTVALSTPRAGNLNGLQRFGIHEVEKTKKKKKRPKQGKRKKSCSIMMETVASVELKADRIKWGLGGKKKTTTSFQNLFNLLEDGQDLQTRGKRVEC